MPWAANVHRLWQMQFGVAIKKLQITTTITINWNAVGHECCIGLSEMQFGLATKKLQSTVRHNTLLTTTH